MTVNVKEKLIENVVHRRDEIAEYQLDIDNYVLAVERIPNDYPIDHDLHEEMSKFKSDLANILRSSRVEQGKAITILKVLEQRLEDEFGLLRGSF
tara:strand:+ start:128 stop:412 length:285 start_codon:yes stop_codon:yes gene_type:complete